MRLGTAIEHLVEAYKYASDKEWIQDKVAWALYHTWKDADRKDDPQTDCETCKHHCNNCGYDTMNNTHTVTTSKTIDISNQPEPIIQEVVQVSDDSINKIADAVVKKIMERE